MITDLRATLACCHWWMAPICWIDNITNCKHPTICRIHDGALLRR